MNDVSVGILAMNPIASFDMLKAVSRMRMTQHATVVPLLVAILNSGHPL